MLNYVALFLLVFVVVVMFYGIIAIHDIPYNIAKRRNHPQQDAIHVAGWVSLLTLHVMWPFLWIWATLYRSDRGWGFNGESRKEEGGEQNNEALMEQLESLRARIDELEKAVARFGVQQTQAGEE